MRANSCRLYLLLSISIGIFYGCNHMVASQVVIIEAGRDDSAVRDDQAVPKEQGFRVSARASSEGLANACPHDVGIEDDPAVL